MYGSVASRRTTIYEDLGNEGEILPSSPRSGRSSRFLSSLLVRSCESHHRPCLSLRLFQVFLLFCCIWTFTVVVQSALVIDELTISLEKGAPNGRVRDRIITNGRFPGPKLAIDENYDMRSVRLNVLRGKRAD